MTVTPLPSDPSPPARPGKSGQSVGHLAKAAVAEARAAGVELPKNAQGHAASRIAGGADPASVFAALVEPPVEEPPVTSDPVTPDPEPPQVDPLPGEDGYAPPPPDPTLTALEAVMALLEEEG